MANNNEDKSEPGEKPTEMNPQGEVEVENVANGEIPPVKSKLKADVPEFVPATTGRSEVDGTDGLPTVEVDVDCDPQPQFIPYSCPTGPYVSEMFYQTETVVPTAFHQPQMFAMSPPYASYMAPMGSAQFGPELDAYQAGLNGSGTYGNPVGFGLEPMSNGDVQFQGGGFLPVTTASFSVYNPGLTGFVQYQPYFPPVALPSPQGESTTSRLRRNTAESDWSGQFGEIDNLRASEYHPAGYIISPIPPGEEICQFANGNGDGLGPEDIYEVEVGRAESFRIPQQSDGCGSLSSSTKSRGGGEVPPRFLKNLQRRQHHGGFSTNFSYANGRQAWPAAFDIWSNSPVEADWEYQQGADGGAQPVEFTVGRWDQASFGHQHAFQPDYYAAHNSRHWSQPGPSQSHPRPNRQPPPTGYGANLVRRHNKYLTNSDAQTDFEAEVWDRPLTDVVRCGHARFIGRSNLDEVGLKPDCQPRTWTYRSRDFASRLVQVPPPLGNDYRERILEASQTGFVPSHSRDPLVNGELCSSDQSDRPVADQQFSYSQALKGDVRHQNYSDSGQTRNSMWGPSRDAGKKPRGEAEISDGPGPIPTISRPVGRKSKETLSLADFMQGGNLKKTAKQKNNKNINKGEIVTAADSNSKGKDKTIAKEKNERKSGETGVDSNTVENEVRDPIEVAAKNAIHSRRFRSYCDNLVSGLLKEKMTSFILELQRFQQKAHEKDSLKAKQRRRMVFGLKEILKLAKVERLKCVLIATNVEDINFQGGLNDILSEIVTECRQQNLPCLFGLTRQELGKLTHKKPVVSAIGILNYQGAEEIFKCLMAEGERLRGLYKELMEWKRAELSSEADRATTEEISAELAQLQLESNGDSLTESVEEEENLPSQSDTDDNSTLVSEEDEEVADVLGSDEGDEV